MRIVVKVGSSTLTHTNGHLRIRTAETLCRALCDLKNSGNEVVLVSSGAISMGVGKLGLSARPHDMPGKQAAAAVGQCELMYAYDKLFTEYAQSVAQILLTGEDLQHADRCENFRNTVTRLLSLSVLPIINEIAIENGVRPERPIAASVVSSQNAVCGTPLAAATAALVGFLEESGSVDMITVLMVVIPATLLGSLASGLIMMKRGKELADDPEFQRRVADGTLVLRGHKEEKVVDTSSFSKQSKISVIAFLVAMVAVVLLGVVKSLRPVLADGSTMGMTDIIQIFMLCAAAVICLVMDKKADAILEMPVFKSGVFAAVICLGLCWMVNIFIGAQSTFLTETVSQFTNKYPWVFIIACYLVGNITTSQGSTTAIVIPLGLALGISTPVLLGGWVTIGSHFLIPAASESLAAIAFDTAGTTKIGKFVFNTSYLLPSLVMAVVDAAVAFLLASVIL